MNFLNPSSQGKKMIDKVFVSAVKAKDAINKYGEQSVVNATLGTLYDESGNLVAFKSVWEPFEELSAIKKAKYASGIQGNPEFQNSVKSWLFNHEDINCEIIATPGGAGAISSVIKNTLAPGQTVIKPSLSWGPYTTMAYEFGMNLAEYNLFNNDLFDLTSFQTVCEETMAKDGKVFVIINDPCHNPTGYTLSDSEWSSILEILETLSKKGPVILLHDIAYIDFSKDGAYKNGGLLRYNNIPDNVMVVVAFSLSKTFTAYGMRVGATIAITNKEQDLIEFKNAMIYSARSIWSTVNNSIMELFSTIESNDEYRKNYIIEKNKYVKLINERAEIFIQEANEVHLPIYPYKEGFFVTIKVPDEKIEVLNKKLQDENIFLVEVSHGLRVALCSVPKHKLPGLAKRIKTIMES
jgi:aspartate aminotransferase/aromatic-amino-acid transaminase